MMPIDPKNLECVAFLAAETNGEFHFGGTGFYVGVPSGSGSDEQFIYLVTAKHNVERGRRKGRLHARVNVVDGSSEFIPLAGDWYDHDDPAVDVTVTEFFLPASYEQIVVPISHFIDEAVIKDCNIGAGTQVLALGLFTYRHGVQRNLPILRAGIVAAMAGESLEDSGTGGPFRAYLVELMSLGGLSGSPVFAVVRARTTRGSSSSTVMRLLGMVRGHWEAEELTQLDFGEEATKIHTGIATVTPSEEIMQVLMSHELRERRRRVDTS